jgi:hypothetical protein
LEAVYLGAIDFGKHAQLDTLFRSADGAGVRQSANSALGLSSRSIALTNEGGVCLTTAINASERPKDSFFLGSLEDQGAKLARYISGVGIAASPEAHQLGKTAIELLNSLSESVSPDAALRQLSFLKPMTVSVLLPDQYGLVELFDQTVISKRKRQLLGMLRNIESRLEDMHSVTTDGEQRLYVELEGVKDALPLFQLGHGFSRLVHLYCSLLVTTAKLALIDEVENGIHYASLPTLFHGIQDIAANHGVQTLMTTHSWDCIRAAYQTFADTNSLQDFQLIRLERDGDNIKSVVINDEALDTVMEAGYEVR